MKLGKVQVLGTLKAEDVSFVSKKTGQKEVFHKSVVTVFWPQENCVLKVVPAFGCTFTGADMPFGEMTVVRLDFGADVAECVLKP